MRANDFDPNRDWVSETVQNEVTSDPAFATAYEAELQAELLGKIDREELTRQLVRARKEKGLSQAAVAAGIGVTQARVSQIENLVGDVSVSALLAYARAVGGQISFQQDRAEVKQVAEKRRSFHKG